MSALWPLLPQNVKENGINIIEVIYFIWSVQVFASDQFCPTEPQRFLTKLLWFGQSHESQSCEQAHDSLTMYVLPITDAHKTFEQ